MKEYIAIDGTVSAVYKNVCPAALIMQENLTNPPYMYIILCRTSSSTYETLSVAIPYTDQRPIVNIGEKVKAIGNLFALDTIPIKGFLICTEKLKKL